MSKPTYTLCLTPESAAEKLRELGGAAVIVDVPTLGKLELAFKEGLPTSDDLREFYAGLDPGIREVVRYLNRHGFDTTDSGDGVTKPAAGWSEDETLDYPHVFVSTPVHCMVETARRLRMCALGAEGTGAFPPGWKVELSYDPSEDHTDAIISLTWPPAHG